MHRFATRLTVGVVAVVAAACSSSDTSDAPSSATTSRTTAATTSTSTVPTTTAAATTTIVIAMTAGAQPGPVPDYAAQGPFPVGAHQYTIPDDGEGRPVPITMWYPAVADGGTTTTSALAEDGTAAVQAAVLDALPDLVGGPFPLLVISPGLGGPIGVYTPLASHLASYGFVVVGADHGDAFLGPESRTTGLLYDRPHDVVREIAYADSLTAPGGALAGLIDTEHIAVLGHSTGGTTTFQAGGARVDFPALEAWCTDKVADPLAAETCQFVGQRDVLAAQHGGDASQGDLLPPLADSRVDALVAMAPGGELHAFGDSGISAVKIPTLILQGTADDVVSPEYNAYWAYEHIGSANKTLVKIEGGTHLMFISCCGYDPTAGGPRSEDVRAHLTTAFVLDILRSDTTAHSALLPNAVTFDGVDYTTTAR
jgi:predicted dienelactone hydrolase